MPDYRKKIGTKDKPLELKTPPGTASYTMHVDEKDGNSFTRQLKSKSSVRARLRRTIE